jgi:ATP-binding cassette, subfamily C (CFTR/MRP), member 1
MTIIDTELPYSLVDLSLSVITTTMGAILMCLSASYFASLMPPVILAVWGKALISSPPGAFG